MRPLDAALAYAEKFNWLVFPRPGGRFVGHGKNDATRDREKIISWWSEWPDALIGARTGADSNLVVADIDRKNGKDGFDTLEALGKSVLPTTPMAHTPHGGLHLYFRAHPIVKIPTGTDVLGPGIDVLGEGGSVALPTPGWNYRWDPQHRPSLTPFLVAPLWLAPRRRRARDPSYFAGNLKPELILDKACELIRHAAPGQRNAVINRQAFLIGALVASGALDRGNAEHELSAAAATMVRLTRADGSKAAYDLERSFGHGQARGRRR